MNTKQKRIALITLGFILALTFLFFSNHTLKILFQDKIWAHKINSIERLDKSKNSFSGVELDVVYYPSENYFDINHPPEESSNLRLKEYFRSQKKHDNQYYWIDFKNLNKENEQNSSNRLDSLTMIFNINPNNIIVESTNPNLLKLFLEKGYKTSYYLPFELHKLNKKELEITIQKIKQNIATNDNTYISSSYKDYEIVNKEFPYQKKLFWFVTIGSMNIIKARILIYKILLDKNVDILLIPFKE